MPAGGEAGRGGGARRQGRHSRARAERGGRDGPERSKPNGSAAATVGRRLAASSGARWRRYCCCCCCCCGREAEEEEARAAAAAVASDGVGALLPAAVSSAVGGGPSGGSPLSAEPGPGLRFASPGYFYTKPAGFRWGRVVRRGIFF